MVEEGAGNGRREGDAIKSPMPNADVPADGFNRVIREIQAFAEPDRRYLVYFLAQFRRIGHTVEEPFMVHQIYGGQYDEIIIVTGAPGSWANPMVHQFHAGRMRFLEHADLDLYGVGFLDKGMATIGNIDLLLIHDASLNLHYLNFLKRGRRFQPLQLPPEAERIGDAWMAERGLDPSQPCVLMHVRDSGFRITGANREIREGDITSYRPAVEYLLDQGYLVVRIGDAESPRLGLDSPHLVELSHAEHDPALDVYFAARCRFALTMSSGPNSLVTLLGRPHIVFNFALHDLMSFHPSDLFVPKSFRWRASGEPVTFSEFVAGGMHKFGYNSDFQVAGVEVLPCTAEEILAAVQELDGRLDHQPPAESPARGRLREQVRALHATTGDFGFFSIGAGSIADTFLERPPELLR